MWLVLPLLLNTPFSAGILCVAGVMSYTPLAQFYFMHLSVSSPRANCGPFSRIQIFIFYIIRYHGTATARKSFLQVELFFLSFLFKCKSNCSTRVLIFCPDHPWPSPPASHIPKRYFVFFLRAISNCEAIHHVKGV